MTRSRLTAVLSALVALAAAGLMAAPEARAHETDQYTLPRRDFADLGPYFNAYFYDAIERGVKRVNDRIASARGSPPSSPQYATNVTAFMPGIWASLSGM